MNRLWAIGQVMFLFLSWSLLGPIEPAFAWQVPPGFVVETLHDHLGDPTALAFSPEGTLFVTAMLAGRLLAFPRGPTGSYSRSVTLVTGLEEPLGVTWHEGYLYITHSGRISRLRLDGLRVAERREIVSNLPQGMGHNTDTVRVGPDGWLYVTQGSSCNVCVEKDPRRAAMVRYRRDGSGEEVFAQGLRNCFGFDFHPLTGEIWGVDNGRDWLGDNTPPEELARIVKGGHYGWPYCYGKKVTDRTFPPPNPDFCRTTQPSVLDLDPHAGAAGVAFYSGATFPEEYRNSLFVAMSGSWNRSIAIGYEVGRIDFRGGQPLRWQTFLRHDWLTQFQPVGVAVGPDGALYVTDLKQGGRILRIQYTRRAK